MADAPIICAAVVLFDSIEAPITCVLILSSDPPCGTRNGIKSLMARLICRV